MPSNQFEWIGISRCHIFGPGVADFCRMFLGDLVAVAEHFGNQGSGNLEDERLQSSVACSLSQATHWSWVIVGVVFACLKPICTTTLNLLFLAQMKNVRIRCRVVGPEAKYSSPHLR